MLFMKRMAEVSGGRLMAADHEELSGGLPDGVVVYQIAGPLFFGAAQRAMSALQRWEKGVKVVVLDLREGQLAPSELEISGSRDLQHGFAARLAGVPRADRREIVAAELFDPAALPGDCGRYVGRWVGEALEARATKR